MRHRIPLRSSAPLVPSVGLPGRPVGNGWRTSIRGGVSPDPVVIETCDIQGGHQTFVLSEPRLYWATLSPSCAGSLMDGFSIVFLTRFLTRFRLLGCRHSSGEREDGGAASARDEWSTGGI